MREKMNSKLIATIAISLQGLSRVLFSRLSGYCCYCGRYAGMNSVISRGFMFCDKCYDDLQKWLNDSECIFKPFVGFKLKRHK